MFFFFRLFFFIYKKFLNLVEFSFFRVRCDVGGARFYKSDLIVVVIFFLLLVLFVLFLFSYLFLKFFINFIFPLYFTFKRFFSVFINKAFLFFYFKLIDLLFIIFLLFYRFYNFLFFGVSYQDPIIKSLSQNLGIVKSEILKEFYLLGHSYLFDIDLAVPTSFFSSAKIFDTVRSTYLLANYSNHFKILIELQQFLRGYFFFFSLSNLQENYIDNKPLPTTIVISRSGVTSNKTSISIFKFIGAITFAKFFYFCRFQALKMDTALFLFLHNLEKFARMHLYTFSFGGLLLYKYLDFLRRTSKVFAFDFQNDSFINYFFYLTKRFYASPMSSILTEVYVRKKIKLSQLVLPSVSFFPVFFRDNFFVLFFSFLFVFLNVFFFSIFLFLYSFFSRSFFFFRYFSSLFSKSNILDFWFFSLIRDLILIFFIDYYKTYNKYYFLHWFRFRVALDFLILNFQFLLNLISFVKLLFRFGFLAFLKFVFYYFSNFTFFYDPFFQANENHQIIDEILFDRYKLLLKAKDNEYFEKFSAFNQNSLEILNSSSAARQRLEDTIFSYFQRKITNLDVVFLRKFFFINFVKARIRFNFFLSRFFLFIFYICVSNFIWFFNILFTHSYFFLNSIFYFIVVFFFYIELGIMILIKSFIWLGVYSYKIAQYFLELSFLLLYKIYFYVIDQFSFVIFLIFFLFFSSIKLLINFFFFCFILSVIFLFKFLLFISYLVFVFVSCIVFIFYMILYFLLYYVLKDTFFYYFFLYIYSFFLRLMFSSNARAFAFGRNLGFSQILGILYLIRINFKSQQISYLKTNFLTGGSLMTDFQVSDFFSGFIGRMPFFQYSSFRPKFLLFSEYLSKLLPNIAKGRLAFKIDLFCKLVSKNATNDDIEEKFIRNLRKKYGNYCNDKARLTLSRAVPLKYKAKFVPLKTAKIPDRLLAEFNYHKFLRMRSFPGLKTFRYPIETLLTSIFYDKRFDNELFFFPLAKNRSMVTSNLLTYFYQNDFFFLKDFAFFREIFSRKNLHFFYAGLDLVSNFRVKFGKVSPVFRYFYLKRERLKFIFSHHLLGDISPFVYAIALNWLSNYRLLRSVLLDANSFFRKIKSSIRYSLPFFEIIFLFNFFDIFFMITYVLKDYFFRFILFFSLSFFLYDYYLLLFVLFLLFFSPLVFFRHRLRIKCFLSFFSYTRPFFFTLTYWFYSLVRSPFSQGPMVFLLLNSVRFFFSHIFFRLFYFFLLCFLVLFFLLFSYQGEFLSLILAICSVKVNFLWLGFLDVLILLSFDDFYIEDSFSGNFYRPFFSLHVNFFSLFFSFLFFFVFFFRFLNFVLLLVKRRVFFSSLFFKFKLSPFRLLKELDFLISMSESENLFIKINISKQKCKNTNRLVICEKDAFKN